MEIKRAKLFSLLGFAYLCISLCASVNPHKPGAFFTVGSGFDEDSHFLELSSTWLFNPRWSSGESVDVENRRSEDSVIRMFGEGDEHIDLQLPSQKFNAEEASSFVTMPTPGSYTPLPPPCLSLPCPFPSSLSASPLAASLSPELSPWFTPSSSPSFPPPPLPVPSSPPPFPHAPNPSAPFPPPWPAPTPVSPFPPSTPPQSSSPVSPPPSAPSISPTPTSPSSSSAPSPFVSPSQIFPPSPSPSSSTLPSPTPYPIFTPSPSSSPSESISPSPFPIFTPAPTSLSPSVSPSSSPSSIFPPSTIPSPFVSPPPSPAPSSPVSPSPSLYPIFPPSPFPSPIESPSPAPSPIFPPAPTSLPPVSSPTSSPSPTPSPSSIPSPAPIPPHITMLANLTISNGAKLVPQFNPYTFNYTASFGSKVRRFYVIAYLPEDTEDYSLCIDSIPLETGKKSPPLRLGKKGQTLTFHIFVRSISHDPSTYALSVTREASHKGLGIVATVFVVLACIVGAVIFLVIGYATYVYVRRGRMPRLSDFQHPQKRESLYTPLITAETSSAAFRL